MSNFALMLTTRMVRRYLQLYNETMPIHRSIKKQGIYIVAIYDQESNFYKAER